MNDHVNIYKDVSLINKKSKAAFKIISLSNSNDRNLAILNTAEIIKTNINNILAANEIDINNAKDKNLNNAFIDRLMLNGDRINNIILGLINISKMDDPLGCELARWKQPNGLDISRVSVPLGVIGIIYESRPNVTVDAGSLCIKSGNTVILRGGSDSIYTSRIFTQFLREGLLSANLPSDTVQMVDSTNREAVSAMLQAVGEIDVIIPRGGKSLVEKIQKEARVPVFAHLEGICHVYIDSEADIEKAIKIVVNSKMRRTGICGALETLLIDKKISKNVIPILAHKLRTKGCQLKGDEETILIDKDINLAFDVDWKTEYLDAILSIKIVDGVNGAIKHIEEYSSHHTECIITENKNTADIFLSKVDSAIVMHNASTQFADGGEFGMGAEIGISTGRIHARGPVGAAQLTSFKYIVRGKDQIRD
jgi:glutamate-5-semialdehyde dehydrogenase